MVDDRLSWRGLLGLIAKELRRHWFLVVLAGGILAALNALLDWLDPSGRASLYAGFGTTAAQLIVTSVALKNWGYSRRSSRLLPFIGLSIVSTIGIGLISLALLLPGFWLYARWFLATPIFVAEEAGVLQSLSESFARTRQIYWPLVTLSLLFVVVAFGPSIILSAVRGEVHTFAENLLVYLFMFGGLITLWLSAVAVYRHGPAEQTLREVFA